MIDVLGCIYSVCHLKKDDIKNHIQINPFKLPAFQKGIIAKMIGEQQKKADQFINNHVKKIEFTHEENQSVLVVPDEVTSIRGFTAIPPFLRIFPSKLGKCLSQIYLYSSR